MNNQFIIDWISFSCPVEWTHWSQMWLDMLFSLEEYLPGAREIVQLDKFDRRAEVPARRPYRVVMVNPDNGIHLHVNLDIPHVLFEVGGSACALLRQQGQLMPLLTAVQARLTRLDIALDIQTNMSPLDLTKHLTGAPVRSRTEISSDMGETLYLGSPKSERFARIYKYNEPHPRAGVLRVEFVLRRAFAKALAKAIADSGLQSVGAALLSKYGLAETLNVSAGDAEGIDLSLPAESREYAKTLFWLNKQVAPALIKLARAGVLDPQEWLEREVKSKLGLTAGGAPADNWE